MRFSTSAPCWTRWLCDTSKFFPAVIRPCPRKYWQTGRRPKKHCSLSELSRRQNTFSKLLPLLTAGNLASQSGIYRCSNWLVQISGVRTRRYSTLSITSCLLSRMCSGWWCWPRQEVGEVAVSCIALRLRRIVGLVYLYHPSRTTPVPLSANLEGGGSGVRHKYCQCPQMQVVRNLDHCIAT